MMVGAVAAALVALQLVLAALYYLVARRRSEVMLVDFYSYRPPDRRVAPAMSTRNTAIRQWWTSTPTARPTGVCPQQCPLVTLLVGSGGLLLLPPA